MLGLIRLVPSGLAAPFMALPGVRYRRERVLTVVDAVRALLIAVTAIITSAYWSTQ